MKNLFFIAVFLLSALSMSAQKELAVEGQYPGDDKAVQVFTTAVEKQSNEASALRTTWVANRPQDNWFISIQGGGTGMISDEMMEFNFVNPFKWFDAESPAYWHPSLGLSVGKWFSPVWGLRFNAHYGGAQGFYNGIREGDFGTDGKAIGAKARDVSSFNYYQATFDYMINLKNFFMAYNPNGFFNPVLYVGTGLVHTASDFNPKDGHFGLATKAGMQLNFRLCKAFDIFLDGNATVVPMAFDGHPTGTIAACDVLTQASLGFTYKFNFRPFIKAPLYDPREIDALNKEINDLRNRPEVVCPPVVVCPEPVTVVEKVEEKEELTPVFFLINSHVVRDNQLISVTKAAEYLINNPGSKLELASYADRKTGTPSYNMQLSKKRSEAVADILVKKFGIEKSRLVLKHYGDTVQPFAENDWNRVTIFILP